MRYVSLHSHSTFSFMDGYALPEAHVARVASLGMGALALTEHGNVSSQVRLEKSALVAGIQPIYGCELYTAATRTRRKWHLTVLAASQEGYANLNRLVSAAWADGFYQWPTVDGAMLAKYSEGLIVLSGCADSKLACDLLGGKGREPHGSSAGEAEALETIASFKRLFGDRYYLECQQFPELERTRTLNPWYEEAGRKLGVELVATSDCHYPMPDDNEMQKILHAAGRNIGTVAQAEQSWEYNILLTYPHSDRLIYDRLLATGLSKRGAEAAIINTEVIAQRCKGIILPKAQRLRYPLEGYDTSKDLIWEWLRDGWKYRWAKNKSMQARRTEYAQRVDYEMGLIESKDFLDYFLMLSDVVRSAKDKGIPVGPARGSAAASLVCYLLRITEVDPMQFPTMVFERFIDVTRMDLPDVDLDFADDRRHEIREHLVERYGADHVGNIGNFIKYRGKNSVNDVAKVYRVPFFEAEKVKNLIIERSGGDSRYGDSLEDTKTTFPIAAEVFAKYPDLDNAIRLEGNMRGLSVHAAGLVVSATPITDTCAVYTRESAGRRVSVLAYDKYDAEHLGILKVDALGLITMGMINLALQSLNMSLESLYDIPLDDPETLAAFHRADVVGIFQFEGRATRLVTGEVRPDNFMELADINALSRPGPLFSGATHQYWLTKHGEVQAMHLHPIVDEITKWSNYQIIYQEQILRIVREVGGFPWTHAAAIRKIISQKKGEAAFNEMQQMFLDGAKSLHGISNELAITIWKQLVTSGTYAFNVAHCISYSMLGFWCMWLKVHHPLEFYTAQLQKIDSTRWPRLLRDAQKHGINVAPPHFNESGLTWTARPETSSILAGFTQIPGIGDSYARTIMERREGDRWL